MSALRSLARSVAHANMADLGMTQVNKRKYGLPSTFSLQWRLYVNLDTWKQRNKEKRKRGKRVV